MININSIIKNIAKDNIEREKVNFCKFACFSNQAIRRQPKREKTPDKKNIRAAFFHDTDRIIHSLAYTRYIDKTQVFYLFKNDHITHRVLHVQFVAKIGRVIGRCLSLNEDLIEAISLGHDMGHVPYGHDGEKVLNRICQTYRIGCFSHNVQSVRFLTDIEKNGVGLNLTLQVLDGILTHNGELLGKRYEPDYKKTLNGFEKEYRRCFKNSAYSRKIHPMTLEGCVARVSDIIAYIGRDIEDAITVKLIKRKSVPRAIKRVLGESNDKIINTLVMDLIANSHNKPFLEFSSDIFKALKDLRQFNYQEIYLNPVIKTQSNKVENMFLRLFDKYYNDLTDKVKDSFVYRYYSRMSPHYRSVTDKRRVVIDFIAGMTDDFFNDQFKAVFVPKSYGYVFNPKSR